MSGTRQLVIPYSERPKKRLRNALLVPFSKKHRQRRDIANLAPELATPFYRAMLSPDRRLFYVRNPKCGCTTIAQLFHAYCFGHTYDGQVCDNTELTQGIDNWRPFMETISNAGTFKFTFTRDPVSRARSAFFDFFIDQRNASRAPHVANMISMGLNEASTTSEKFDLFLDYVELNFERSRRYSDGHWRPQIYNIAYGSIPYDFIGDVEEIQSGMGKVFDAAGVSGRMQEFLANARFNRSSSQSMKDFVLSDRQVSRLQNLYEEDFRAFGYG